MNILPNKSSKKYGAQEKKNKGLPVGFELKSENDHESNVAVVETGFEDYVMSRARRSGSRVSAVEYLSCGSPNELHLALVLEHIGLMTNWMCGF